MAKDSSRGRGSGGGHGGRGGRGSRDNRGAKPLAAKKTTAVPANWPPQVAYLTTPVYSGISAHQRQQLQKQQPQGQGRGGAVSNILLPEVPPILRFGPSPLVEIRTIADPTHPACGQRGLFAARALAAGSFVVPYLGVYHRGHVSVSGAAGGPHKDSDYDLWLDRAADVAVDAARAGNEARFVNDYRGTGQPRPNAEFREVWDPRRGERGMAVFVQRAGKRAVPGGSGGSGIAKGEEILVSYGKGFWEMRQKEQEQKQEQKEQNKAKTGGESGGGDGSKSEDVKGEQCKDDGDSPQTTGESRENGGGTVAREKPGSSTAKVTYAVAAVTGALGTLRVDKALPAR